MSQEVKQSKKKQKLIASPLKEIEQQIVDFFLEIGRQYNKNLKLVTIQAYFYIYQALTQKQLKKLTSFSSSTISTTLQLFIKSNALAGTFSGLILYSCSNLI